MGGNVGKRAKPPKACQKCGKKITGDFLRMKDGDYHLECRWLESTE